MDFFYCAFVLVNERGFSEVIVFFCDLWMIFVNCGSRFGKMRVVEKGGDCYATFLKRVYVIIGYEWRKEKIMDG